ncbi:MAG: RNA-guided endonuclease TnpB family protein [Candidatus Woesearchaeota archaeon]
MGSERESCRKEGVKNRKLQVAYKFRLYPSKKIESKMLGSLELCRQTYNMLLGELNSQKVIDKAQIQGIIPDIKICEPKFKNIHSKTMQMECYRLFSNLRGLAQSKGKRKVGRLRFKSKNRFKTFTYNQTGFKLIATGKRHQTLWLSKIGEIPIRCHRNITGKIKQVTIKQTSSGKWFASVIEEQKITVPKLPIKKIVGIDLGLNDIVYDSDGNKTGNPRHLREKAQKLARLQRRMSNKKKGSSNRNKSRIILSRQYEKLVNSRDDFLHKLSRHYVDNYDAIGFEDFQITNMARNHKLSKSILDASWGRLRQFVAYKVERTGKHYILVNYKGTTQICSQCGEEVAKGLSERMHKCLYCGFVAPRDYNSALEIKNRMFKKIGQGLSESTPVEMEALPLLGQLSSAKQEALCES